jgi:hypothetical protein
MRAIGHIKVHGARFPCWRDVSQNGTREVSPGIKDGESRAVLRKLLEHVEQKRALPSACAASDCHVQGEAITRQQDGPATLVMADEKRIRMRS